VRGTREAVGRGVPGPCGVHGGSGTGKRPGRAGQMGRARASSRRHQLLPGQNSWSPELNAEPNDLRQVEAGTAQESQRDTDYER
jgi:hypothetical protein